MRRRGRPGKGRVAVPNEEGSFLPRNNLSFLDGRRRSSREIPRDGVDLSATIGTFGVCSSKLQYYLIGRCQMRETLVTYGVARTISRKVVGTHTTSTSGRWTVGPSDPTRRHGGTRRQKNRQVTCARGEGMHLQSVHGVVSCHPRSTDFLVTISTKEILLVSQVYEQSNSL